MTERQQQPIAPPRSNDKESLDEYTSVLQGNLERLFRLAHRHSIKTSIPASNEGNPGDIFLVETSGSFRIYAKFSSGWKFVTLS